MNQPIAGAADTNGDRLVYMSMRTSRRPRRRTTRRHRKNWIASMRRYNKFRVPYFKALLDQARKQALQPEAGREIVRRPGNPMLRYVAAASVGDAVPLTATSTQETLDL